MLYIQRTFNIERITQLSQGELSCIEMIVKTDKTINVQDMTGKLLSISSDFGVDIAVQKENIQKIKKACCDGYGQYSYTG